MSFKLINLMKVAPTFRTSTLITISELDGEKDGMFWLYGTICEVETVGAWSYLACKICLKKLKKDDHSFYCERCDSFDVSGRLRYRLRVSVVDDSGSTSLILWDRECLQLIGKSAEELSCDAQGNDMPFEIEAVTNKTALFKINIKPGETKKFDGAYGVTKINCDPNMIEKYCGPDSESEIKQILPKEDAEEVSETKQIHTKDVVKEKGSSSAIIPVNLIDDEQPNKRGKEEIEITVMNDDEQPNKRGKEEIEHTVIKKRGKRVLIKQEKP